jgi:sugar lactone lactonase YvrE
MTPFDPTICTLGEGPLWHPLRDELFWFDITGKKLYARKGEETRQLSFGRYFSAAGWVDETTLIIASQDALWRFDIEAGGKDKLCDLDADNPVTRSNDGRADPWGGFWIGTMGINAEKYAGAIYRYYKGELRTLFTGITVSNAICFAPDQSCAYYTDTHSRRIMRAPLDPATGWPNGPSEVAIDLREAGLNPDGAITDRAGNLWIACWGAGIVLHVTPDGEELRRIDVPVTQPSCPAFGGTDFSDLYITSATQGLSADTLATQPFNGATFCIKGIADGRPDPQVVL